MCDNVEIVVYVQFGSTLLIHFMSRVFPRVEQYSSKTWYSMAVEYSVLWICVSSSLSSDILVVSKFVATLNDAKVSILVHKNYVGI